MIRAVLDTKVLASGIANQDAAKSTTGEIWRRQLAGAFRLVVSASILAELRRTFAKAYFVNRVPEPARRHIDADLSELAEMTGPTIEVRGVATHPEDDLILAAAVSAAADYLVTGDRQLLALGEYSGVRIASPTAFLELLAATPDRPA